MSFRIHSYGSGSTYIYTSQFSKVDGGFEAENSDVIGSISIILGKITSDSSTTHAILDDDVSGTVDTTLLQVEPELTASENFSGIIDTTISWSSNRITGVNFPTVESIITSDGVNLTGISDSSIGILSLWCQISDDFTSRWIFGNSDSTLKVTRQTDNAVSIELWNSDFTSGFGLLVPDAVFAAQGWTNILLAWDTNFDSGSREFHIFIDDEDVHGTPGGNTEFNVGGAFQVNYDSGWTIGALNGAVIQIAQVYFAPGQYLDLNDPANRRKFITDDKKVVDLGSDASTPTGTEPLLYLNAYPGDSVTDFATNKGTGGNIFNIYGEPDIAQTQPPANFFPFTVNVDAEEEFSGIIDTTIFNRYISTAINFAVEPDDYISSDGTNFAGLTSDSNGILSSKGILSMWARVFDDTGSKWLFGNDADDDNGLTRISDTLNQFSLELWDVDHTNGIGVYVPDGILASHGWVHILASWDTDFASGNRLLHLYLNDIESKTGHVLFDMGSAFDVHYPDGWTLGALFGERVELAQIYFNPEEYLDFSIETNRRKFISENLTVVNLGPDGSLPTGNIPIQYLNIVPGETVDDFAENKGTGGDIFTIHGSPTISNNFLPAPDWIDIDINTIASGSLSALERGLLTFTGKHGRSVTRNDVSANENYYPAAKSTLGRNVGNWYLEIEATNIINSDKAAIGFGNGNYDPTQGYNIGSIGSFSAAVYADGSSVSDTINFITSAGSSFDTFISGDIIMLAWDIDHQKAWIGKNGTWFSGNPELGIDPFWTLQNVETIYPGLQVWSLDETFTVLAETEDFNFVPPVGFNAFGDVHTTTLDIDVSAIYEEFATGLIDFIQPKYEFNLVATETFSGTVATDLIKINPLIVAFEIFSGTVDFVLRLEFNVTGTEFLSGAIDTTLSKTAINSVVLEIFSGIIDTSLVQILIDAASDNVPLQAVTADIIFVSPFITTSLNATSAEAVTLAGDITLPKIVFSATATELFSGTIQIDLSYEFNLVATETFSGTISTDLSKTGAVALIASENFITSVDATLKKIIITSTATETIFGAIDSDLVPYEFELNVLEIFSGTVSMLLKKIGPFELSATETMSGTIDVVLNKLIVNISALERMTGTIETELFKTIVELNVLERMLGTTSITLFNPEIEVEGTIDPAGIVTFTLNKSIVSIVGAQTFIGTIALPSVTKLKAPQCRLIGQVKSPASLNKLIGGRKR